MGTSSIRNAERYASSASRGTIIHQMSTDDGRALLAPVLRLSPDILSEIFLSLPVDFPEWAFMSQMTSHHPMVQLSHVCRHFRGVALSTRMLWAIFSILELPVPNDGSEGSLQYSRLKMGRLTNMLSAFIRRAGEFPMGIQIVGLDPDVRLDAQVYAQIMEPFAHLLSSTKLRAVEIFLRILHEASPLLQLLDITRHSDETLVNARFYLIPRDFPIARAIVEHLDLLSAKRLTNVGLGLPGSVVADVKVNWAALTDLTLHRGMRFLTTLGVLGKCINLVRCKVELGPGSSSLLTPPPNLPAPVTLPHLTDLVLSGLQPRDDLPRSLVLPSLRALDIRDGLETFNDFDGNPPINVRVPERSPLPTPSPSPTPRTPNRVRKRHSGSTKAS